ncbi:MAG: hypothetical protein H7067_06325 [Burkholderiales bacterium]|nr:hypothetical protein [Opitutaceae bacterium]
MRNSRSGTLSFRVTGTLRPGGKQQKEVFGTLEAAEACRDGWESIRVSNHAALRARATRLSQAELTAAEAATEMQKGTGFNLAKVVLLSSKTDEQTIPENQTGRGGDRIPRVPWPGGRNE